MNYIYYVYINFMSSNFKLTKKKKGKPESLALRPAYFTINGLMWKEKPKRIRQFLMDFRGAAQVIHV